MIRTEQRPTLFNIFLIIQFVQNNITKKRLNFQWRHIILLLILLHGKN